jgi:hypothetical protein
MWLGYRKRTGACSGHDLIGLVAELRSELAVCGKHLCGREYLLCIPRRVRRDLCRFVALESSPFQVFAYLLAAWTRRIQILLCVSLDLRRATTPRLDLVAEIAQPVHQPGLIDGGSELLGLKEAPGLNSARTVIGALGRVEDHGMGMELRRGITVHRPCRVMLEFCGNELPRRLRRMVAANARLRVPLQLRERCRHRLAVGDPHAIVATHESGQ